VVTAVRRKNLGSSSVQTGHPNRVLNGFSATVCEKDFLGTVKGAIEDHFCGEVARFVTMLWGNGGEDARLFLNCRYDGWMLVTDVGVYQLGGEVEKLGAVFGRDVHALRGFHHKWDDGALGGPGVKD